MAANETCEALTERVAAIEKELHDTQQKFQHSQEKLVAIQESEKLYRLVVDHAEDAISLMDVESKQRIHVNKTAQKMK